LLASWLRLTRAAVSAWLHAAGWRFILPDLSRVWSDIKLWKREGFYFSFFKVLARLTRLTRKLRLCTPFNTWDHHHSNSVKLGFFLQIQFRSVTTKLQKKKLPEFFNNWQ
jgi:hypothetical protein